MAKVDADTEAQVQPQAEAQAETEEEEEEEEEEETQWYQKSDSLFDLQTDLISQEKIDLVPQLNLRASI